MQSSPISLAAGPAYRRGVLRLLVGLGAFVALYLALMIGCLAMIGVAAGAAWIQPWLAPLALVIALLFGPLLWFMVRGLVHRPQLGDAAVRVDARAHPRLFEFLDRLASDARAARVHRVSLGAGVNAAMIAGFGSARELVIGLGLVNVLDLRELEAALAHEFGHFAQSSTRVGQWAYRVTLVLREVVIGRTRHDARLARGRVARSLVVRGFSTLASVGVRGLRLVLGLALARVTRLSLALARELEFNADLHAVALCGSDALVEALREVQRGTLAMDAAVGQLVVLARHGVFSADIYAHQSAALAEIDAQLAAAADPMLQALARPYAPGPELHFPPGEVPAEMTWYSHPSYHERERNAKRSYVEVGSVALERTSAWSLFDELPALRRELSLRAYARLGFSPKPEQLRPAAAVAERIGAERAERAQGAHYHGFYDNRVVDPGPLDELLTQLQAELDDGLEHDVLRAEVEAWRGPALAAFMAGWREIEAGLERARAGAADPDALTATREAQVTAAQAGDRALLRWLWARADDEARAELVERHRFLAFVQRQLAVLNAHRDQIAALSSRVDPREHELAAHAPVELLSALDVLHRDLSALFDEARTLAVPSLHAVEAGSSLASLLSQQGLLEALDDDAALGPWLQRFMTQTRDVHARLQTLHYKNLGQLLRLHERIDPALSESDDDRRRELDGR